MRLAAYTLFISLVWAGSVLAQPLAFITSDQTAGTVSVVNLLNNRIIRTIPVGSFPFSIGTLPDGDFVYVGNRFDGNVSVISTAMLEVVDTVFVGDQPLGVAVSPDSSLVYVITINTGALKVIRTSDNTVIADLDFLVNPQSLAFHPSGEFVYISDAFTDTLEVVRTSDNTVVASIPITPNPRGVVVSPDGGFVYVAIGFNDEIAIVDTETNTVVDTIENAGTDPFCIAITPDGETLYVTNAPNSDEVTAVNIADKSVKAIAVDGNTSGVDVTPDGKFVYAAGNEADLVYVINTEVNTIVDTIPVPNPSSCGRFITVRVIPPIPTLSEWGLIAMAGVLGIIGLLAVRRRKITA